MTYSNTTIKNIIRHMPETHKLAFIGFGVVGQGLAEILIQKQNQLRDEQGVELSIVAVCDLARGSVYDENGLDAQQLLSLAKEKRGLDEYPGGVKGLDALQTIRECNADTIVEVTFTDVKTGEPAISHCRAAFESGKNIVTTNKGPVALAYRELQQLAEEQGVRFGFEGAVMSGTPVLNTAMKNLAGCSFGAVKGILNGTTNFMLSEMEQGGNYDDVLKKAQQLGYAEADPTADVEGWDVLAKVVILANVLMGADLKVADVPRTGITGITAEDIAQATQEGCRWKLIGEVRREGEKVSASVAPQKLPLDDPLTGVGGATNAITFETDLAGPVTIVGAGAGKVETGFALLSDILEIHRSAGH